MDLRSLLWSLLGFGLLPLWLLAGAADWVCHRRSRIALTSGPRESAVHALLHLQVALPVSIALWLEITAPLLVLMALAVAAHMFTSWVDTSLAQPRRHIAPIEQQVHSWLEMLPLFALLCIALLHTGELVSPRWEFLPRSAPIAPVWRMAILGGFAAGLLMIVEEWWRGMRAQTHQGLLPGSE
jgi:hypothetical protein